MPVLRKRPGGSGTGRWVGTKPYGLETEARSRPLREGPLNREALSDRLALLPVPQRAVDRPEQTIERSKHDSQANTKDGLGARMR